MSYSTMGEPLQRADCQRFGAAVRVLLAWTIWTISILSTGCLLPLAPDFQDPPKAPNYPPAFRTITPFPETANPQGPTQFHVDIEDPNPSDTLYVRWVADYPPFVMNRTKQLGLDVVILPGQARVANYQLPETESCRIFTLGGGPDHRLVVIVSDRPFVTANQFNDTYRFSLALGGGTPLMASWTITGCPQ